MQAASFWIGVEFETETLFMEAIRTSNWLVNKGAWQTLVLLAFILG